MSFWHNLNGLIKYIRKQTIKYKTENQNFFIRARILFKTFWFCAIMVKKSSFRAKIRMVTKRLLHPMSHRLWIIGYESQAMSNRIWIIGFESYRTYGHRLWPFILELTKLLHLGRPTSANLEFFQGITYTMKPLFHL